MSKKEYKVLDEGGTHDYTIVVEKVKKGRRLSLFISNGEHWNYHVRNTLQLSILDHGNGITLDRKIKKMDYHEALALRLLLTFEYKTSKNPMDRLMYEVIKAKNLIEI